MKIEQNNFEKLNTETIELVSLGELLAPLWHARWLICIVTSLVAACIVSWTLLNPTYRSQGFFQFSGAIPQPERDTIGEKDWEKEKKKEELSPGISLADFKRFSASYETGERFNDYIHDKKLTSVSGVDSMSQLFFRSRISNLIEPVYPFTKLDLKELVDQPKGSSNNVIGLRISYESNSPEAAQQMVELLGRYAIDSIVYLIYSDLLHSKSNELRSQIMEMDNVVIKENIRLEEYRRQAAELKKIVKNNPETSEALRGQVVTITEDTARYLPPARLVTTTEVRILEANELIRKARYQQVKSQVLLEYYDRLKSILDSTKSGETVLHSLESAKASVFKDKNLKDDAVREIYNTITVNNQQALNVYLNKSRFIAGPTLPRHSTTRLGSLLIISLVVGLFISIIFVYARNRRVI